MNAKQALLKSLSSEFDDGDLKYAMSNIKDACNAGHTQCSVTSLTPKVQQYLKNKGYEVRCFDSGWGTGYDLSWGPKKPRRKFLGLF